MNSLFCLVAVSVIACLEAKPFFPTDTPRDHPTIVCVSKEDCVISGVFKEGYYRHPIDSTWFYSCVGGNPECQQCPEGLFYHRICNMCLEVENEVSVTAANCPATPPPVTATAEALVCQDNFCSDKEDGLYTDVGDEQRFFHCSNKLTHCKKCQMGLKFDKSCDACVDPSHTTSITVIA